MQARTEIHQELPVELLEVCHLKINLAQSFDESQPKISA